MTGAPSDPRPRGPDTDGGSAADAAPLSRALRLMWGETEGPRRGPKPGLTLHHIAETAVRLADEEGLEACTMARLARALGVSAMALYRYVDTKGDLALVMLDAAYGRFVFDWAPGVPWRERLADLARANFEAVRAHPWLLQIPLDNPPVTPSTMTWLEAGLTALDDVALPDQDKLSLLLLVEVFVRGQAQLLALYGPDGSGAATYGRRVQDATTRLPLPRLAAVARRGRFDDEDDGPDTEFRRGLDLILDGVEARLNRAARRE